MHCYVRTALHSSYVMVNCCQYKVYIPYLVHVNMTVCYMHNSAHSCGLNPLLLEVHSKTTTDNMI